MHGRRFAATLFALVLTAIVAQGAAPYGLNTRVPVGPFLNGQMPPTRPGIGAGDYSAVDAFPHLSFEDPTFLIAEPITNRLYVSGRQGTIYWFVHHSNTTTKTLFLDLRTRTQGFEDCGLLGMAFHPEWRQPGSPNRGYVYVWYQYTTNRVFPPPDSDRPNPFYGTWMRLSRFTVPDGQTVASAASEQVLIQQYDRHMWHNGGNIYFGPDGFLYIPVGDEGGIADEFNQTQKLDGGLFSGVLRIDVNRDPTKSHPIRRQPQSPPGAPRSYTTNYFIPNDNPWQDPNGGILEEFWAVGLRSPHRMTRDPVTGQIWLGDVGQNAREEINLIVRGGNYQWPFREGTFPGFTAKPNPLIGSEVPPVYDYGRAQGDTCVIVGYVYRGAEMPELQGKLIFGDNTSGRIWALTYNGSNTPPSVNYLCNIPPGVNYQGLSSFGLDRFGEIYALQMGATGKVWKLARTGPPVVSAPTRLSQTGAFLNTTNLTPRNALIPYDVNSPLWSDGAHKVRWMAVPNDGAPFTSAEQIGFAPTGEWSFPSGTVFVKHFELATNYLNPAQRRRLETRLLVRGTNGNFYGLTYKWLADGSDAEVLPDSLSENIVVNTPSGVRTQTWFYPSPQDCITCHNPNAGSVLGLKARQLNGHFTYPATGVTDNQLRALNHVGLFAPAINEANIPGYARLVKVTDTAAPLNDRVRSYLDANCAQCHRPGGVQGHWDARFDTPLANQHIINGPVFNTFGIPNAREVAPADLTRSIMYLRLHTNDPVMKMPPLARNVVDTDAVNTLAEWITSFVPGPLPPPWQHRDIGNVGVVGNASFVTNAGAFNVSGSGADIWGTADGFHFAYQSVSGDCEVIARVTSIGDSDEWAKAGVMIRESTAPGARNAFIALTAQHGVEYQWRANNNGQSAYQEGALLGAPVWLRLTRTNNSISAFSSLDGFNWSPVHVPVSLNMPSNALAGLAVSAVNNSGLNVSSFDSVRVLTHANADSDGDGMPDSYELANGFDRFNAADAIQDSDGDGVPNQHEFRAGTNPRSAASVLRITRMQRVGNDLVLSFLSGTGAIYAIDRTTNLPSFTWQTLTNVGPFSNSPTTITNSGGAKFPNSFYRVRVPGP